MSKNVIIFGAKKFGVSNSANTSATKYPNNAVITVEPSKEGGRSRRVLFNAKACEVLNLENSEVQQIVFGFVEGDCVGLIANASLLESDVINSMTTYRTSKNRVNFEETKEKGKAISSSSIANELSSYFELDSTTIGEFRLNSYDTEGVESFSMEFMPNGIDELSTEASNQDVDFEEVSETPTPTPTATATVEDLLQPVEPVSVDSVEEVNSDDFAIKQRQVAPANASAEQW